MSAISQLTPLLPSTSYLLAYTLPLLLLSLLLTFAGTFLTLDRSRSFPQTANENDGSYAALSAPGGFTSSDNTESKFTWVLEGGLGGLAGGYAFGIHLSTALALLIPATTSAASLSPKSFLAIWILTCTVTTLLSARYRYVAFAFFGISGGTLTALAFCIIAHPSLTSRITLTAIFLPAFTITILLVAILPISGLATLLFHPLLRICTASTGAFGVVLSIALLMKPQEEGWANAWERLWMSNGPEGPDGQIWWGSSQEQGLSAGYAIFLFAGMAMDWGLRSRVGECPDEKWDSFLANYAAGLPHEAHRAGTFQPHKSLLDRFFSGEVHKSEKDILFPNEVDMKMAYAHSNGKPRPLPVTMHNISPKKAKADKDKGIELSSIPSLGPDLLKQKRSKKVRGWRKADGMDRKGRKPVKFGDVSESSDDDDVDATKHAASSSSSGSPLSQHQRLNAIDPKTGQLQGHTYRTSSSTPTLVDAPTGAAREGGKRKDTHTPTPKDDDARRGTIDYEHEIAQLKAQLKRRASQAPGAPGGGDADEFELESSDYEDEGAAQHGLLRRASLVQQERERAAPARGEQDSWRPGFLRRLADEEAGAGAVAPPFPVPMPAPVPATPSLIKALDRLALAHREAYGRKAAPSPLRTPEAAPTGEAAVPGEQAGPGKEGEEAGKNKNQRTPRWEEFWREVRVKAQT